jgi:hypothetical protein
VLEGKTKWVNGKGYFYPTKAEAIQVFYFFALPV